ncbi:acyl carrier protein, partial [Flavobacterium sp. H122]|uniref:acyl carrier protein n=1 Tax=Flavobacterium sp. H122 TaxID=2529860 RepID=UPI0010AAF7FC
KLGDYGLDSILLTRLANELNAYYDLDLMPTVFFNYPTVESLVAFLIEDHAGNLLKQHGDAKQSVTVNRAESIIETKAHEGRIVTKRPDFFAGQSKYTIQGDTSDQSLAPIAIVGISGRFPGSPDLESFWENIKANKDLITEIPSDRWDWRKYYGDPQKEKSKTKAKWGGFITDIDKFDPLFFNISPREAELMDPQQRITLQAVYQALEDAGIPTDKIKGTNTG